MGTRSRRALLREGLWAAGAPLVPWPSHSSASPPAASKVDARGDVLGPLLARNRSKHPGPVFSNHLSMALLSLAALGGSPDRIRQLAEPRLARGQPFPSPGGPPITAQSWREHLGDADALPGFRRFFDEEVSRRGVAGTLAAHLPALMPGVSAHAFHPIIRTGYGVRFDDPAEVAMGLAYWAATYLPLGTLAPANASTVTDPTAALALVRRQPELALLTAEGRRAARVEEPPGLNIAGKMRWVSTLEGFRAGASGLRITDGALSGMAASMVRLHVASGDDFTALHAVTGTHAYRQLESHLPAASRTLARRHLWQALVAAYASIGAPPLPARREQPTPTLPPWPEIIARAAASTDDHDLKLIDVAREEQLFTGDPTYQRAAALRLNLV